MSDRLGFSALLIESNGRRLKAQLELYKFKEDNACIVYCPAMDLSAFGETYEEAKKEFQEIFTTHIEYCIQKNTLIKDLRNHGWVIKSKNQRKIKAPTTEILLGRNDTLKDIIYNKNYEKISEYVEMPEFA
ncbi:hypothetical protein EZS27_031887 [termite gut metagenome]|uniref:Uncharacterized protein n=1 Tax=termite gut metagenome TaxID=433724 RepID=A0A5J4QAG8_9ZZZZ